MTKFKELNNFELLNYEDADGEKIEFVAVGNERLDIAVSRECDVTRSRAKTLIDKGNVSVDGATVTKSGATPAIGAIIAVLIEPIEQLSLEPCDIPIDIVYQDDYIAVINKAQGMVVHPASGSPNGTLVNALLFSLDNLSGINGVARPGIVHRLDKNTSGLLVVAKTDAAHVDLQSQIQIKSARRSYIALVDGVMTKDSGEIITNIDRSKKDRKLMTVVKDGGRLADTLYKVIKRFDRYTLTEYELKTGRTHQIRVHSKHIGYPIVGDAIYGGSTKLYDKGQLLHAYKLVIKHPITQEKLTFYAPLPNYFEQILIKLGGKTILSDIADLMREKY